MHPFVRVATLAAVVSIVAAPRLPPRRAPSSTDGAAVAGQRPDACGKRGLSVVADGRQTCLPLPPASGVRKPARRWKRRQRPRSSPSRAALAVRGQAVARMPERPESLLRYRLPVANAIASLSDRAISDDPMEVAPARLGLDLGLDDAKEVYSLRLHRQEGLAEVMLVGELYGVTVITKHELGDADPKRIVLMIVGNLRQPGPGVVAGAKLKDGAKIGDAADDLDLRVEFRMVRSDATSAAHLSAAVSDAFSTAVDPRNVLPLLPTTAPSPSPAP